ncbi:MAG: hypothetical protein SFV15_12050 [Polyangiaceae bacterium]|nr:hypothetical protein [Polyangiaceae bacterium]
MRLTTANFDFQAADPNGADVVTFSGWVKPRAGADEQNGIIAIGGDLRFDSAGHPGFSIGFDGPNLVMMAFPMRGQPTSLTLPH